MRSEVKDQLAVAMDIKTAVDKHHMTKDRALHELIVSDLADEFEQGTSGGSPSKEKLHALFDRKVSMRRDYF
jgi:hypothetical protein